MIVIVVFSTGVVFFLRMTNYCLILSPKSYIKNIDLAEAQDLICS